MESEATNALRKVFLETVVKNMPDIETDVMWGWINNSKKLKKVLGEALCPPKTNDSVFAQDMRKKGWRIVKDVPEVFPMDKLCFVSFLKDGENFINGKELLIRASEQGANLGQSQAEYCLERKDDIPKCWQGYQMILFTGTVWSDAEGHCFIPSLSHAGGESWYLKFQFIENIWFPDYRLVSVRK